MPKEMKPTLRPWLLLLAAQACRSVGALLRDSYLDEASYVSRPDLKPLIPNITIYRPDLVSPGYWFYAPYMRPVPLSERLAVFIPHQYGPHIYDSHGDLIWSGASLFNWSNVFDFRKTKYKSSDALSLLVAIDNESAITRTETIGVILNSSYEVVKTVTSSNGQGYSDMHEFSVIENGKSALLIVTQWRNVSGGLFNKADNPATNVTYLLDSGFQEVDIETGRMKFEWWAFDHISASDTHWEGRRDIYHMNSVDKTPLGDYLVSVRHTSTIYLVSSKDSSIIWQLGGLHSSFIHTDNFTFSSQHHARIYSQNKTHMVVSFLNNAADEMQVTADCSSALLVLLSMTTSPMTATILRQWDRPDGQLSDRRGNVQTLPNSNVVVGWAGFGYVSEFTFDGILVQEAHSDLERFEEYRQYKFEWSAAGHVTEPIMLTSQMYGTTTNTWTTVLHVSWNGATEVMTWNFYSSTKAGMAEHPSLIASTPRQGFETGAVVPGYYPFVFAEAVAKDGMSLQNSTIETTKRSLYDYDRHQKPWSDLRPKVPHDINLISMNHSDLFPSWLLLLLVTVPPGLAVCLLVCFRCPPSTEEARGRVFNWED